MTCANCEGKITAALLKYPEIDKVQAVASKNSVTIQYDSESLDMICVHQTIEDEGYTVAAKKNVLISTLFTLIGITLLSYLVLRYENAVSFEFIPDIRQSMGYGALFTVGLLTSVHCIAMCGGINMSLCSRYAQNSAFKPSLLYNLGRVTSYTVIGGVVGGIGSVLSFSGQFRGYLTIAVSAVMMLMAMKMLKLFHVKLPSTGLARHLAVIRRAFNKRGPYFVGLANGFMPCGPLQSMQLYALGTGSVVIGALSMFYFSIGTFPLMFGLGFMSTLLNSKLSKHVMKLSGVIIFLLGVSMFSRGASLSGILLPISNAGPATEARVMADSQIVTIDLEANRYEPIRVVKDIPVTMIINAGEGSLNGCNNPVTIPELSIEKTLVPGENIIQFTPTEEGKIAYTCWMGMISSYIDVVEE